jgi:putative ABC transport system permease protein
VTMQVALQNLGYAARRLGKHPGSSFVVFVTLALGIGASTAIFSVVYGVLLRPLPFGKPDQIVRLWELNAAGQQINFDDPNFEDLRAQSHSLQGVAEYRAGQRVVIGSQPVRTNTSDVSRDFFSVMRVQPILGRNFAPEDQHFGAAPTALVGFGYWKEFLGGATDLSQIKLTIQNRSVSVVGVLPPGFAFPDDSQIWLPRELFERLPSRTAHNWRVIARLREGVSLVQAHAELATIARQLKKQYGQDTDMTDVGLLRLQAEMTGPVRPALTILMGAVGFLLLVACLNVANILLAQGAARQKELAIRVAMGASRTQLLLQFLLETLLLSVAGGALGVLVARWTLAGLMKLGPADLSRLSDVSVNLPVLAFALGIAVMVALGLGSFSALRATVGGVPSALTETGRAQLGTPGSQRVNRLIVAGQLALSLVLLTGAGLLGRSLLRVLAVNPGFRTNDVLTMDLALSFADGETEKIRRISFFNALFAGLRAIPGVSDVGGTEWLPLTGSLGDGTYVILNPGEQPPERMDELEQWFHTAPRTGYADYCVASEGFFTALGIPLLRGRLFDDSDTLNAPHAALINESLARQKWPGQDPLGHTIEFGNMDGDLRPLTVVGVVGDVRPDSLESAPRPTIYVNYRQRPQATYHFVVVLRTAQQAPSVISAARETVLRLDPTVPPEFGSFAGIVSASLQARRFNLILVGFFAASALLLAVVGLYGVMAYAVTRRTGEIGVRIALGATPANILRLVLTQGARVALIGAMVGLAGSLALTRTLRSLLFGLSPTDPFTFAAVAFALMAVALLACWVPARRAARVDPMQALRYE